MRSVVLLAGSQQQLICYLNKDIEYTFVSQIQFENTVFQQVAGITPSEIYSSNLSTPDHHANRQHNEHQKQVKTRCSFFHM